GAVGKMDANLHALSDRTHPMRGDEHTLRRQVLGEARVEVVVAAETDIEVHGNPGASPAFFQLERHPDAFLYHVRVGRADIAHSHTSFGTRASEASPWRSRTARGSATLGVPPHLLRQ